MNQQPWNKGKLIGQKPPLKLGEVYAIRVRLELQRRARDLALFNLALDSKLRGCDLVRLRVKDVAHGGQVLPRALVLQRNALYPRYLSSGHIAFVYEGTLTLMGFDPATLEVTSAPAAMVKGVRHMFGNGGANYAVSDNGTADPNDPRRYEEVGKATAGAPIGCACGSGGGQEHSQRNADRKDHRVEIITTNAPVNPKLEALHIHGAKACQVAFPMKCLCAIASVKT